MFQLHNVRGRRCSPGPPPPPTVWDTLWLVVVQVDKRIDHGFSGGEVQRDTFRIGSRNRQAKLGKMANDLQYGVSPCPGTQDRGSSSWAPGIPGVIEGGDFEVT